MIDSFAGAPAAAALAAVVGWAPLVGAAGAVVGLAAAVVGAAGAVVGVGVAAGAHAANVRATPEAMLKDRKFR